MKVSKILLICVFVSKPLNGIEYALNCLKCDSSGENMKPLYTPIEIMQMDKRKHKKQERTKRTSFYETMLDGHEKGGLSFRIMYFREFN
eukprot:TRINITY_DN9048_c0_g1_i1.p1 TRINITY_DN9048_c0_g1~~TRINITY_DN9048_c0_g1_i1.p1  ORF type:complete len:89 (-),score=11.10 TRINITY_DN9048_c0_g1_i1:65-331(-)